MDKKTIGMRLKKLRGKRTMEEVAQAIGVTKQAINLYESGWRTPKDDLKIKIAQYYEKSVQDIFFEH